MIPTRLVIGLAAGLGAITFAAAEDVYVPPVFQAVYESPFAPGVGEVGKPRSRQAAAGTVLFRFWRGRATGDVLAGHLLGSTRDCWSREVHFCIHKGYMTFAAPPPDARPGWTWRLDDDQLRLVSKQKIRFRGELIDAITVRAVSVKFQAAATYFVYSYDIGLIAFSEFNAEDIRPSEDRVPRILRDTLVLAGEHGLGGRENCKHWTCGRSPTTK
jgi:hypothetical protein